MYLSQPGFPRKSGAIFSESEGSNSEDEDNEFTPGVVGLEFRCINLGSNLSEKMNEFLKTQLEESSKTPDSDDEGSDDESSIDHPILPSSEVSEEFETSATKSFMKSLGFQPPSGQHNNWRIPKQLNKLKCLRILSRIKENQDESDDFQDNSQVVQNAARRKENQETEKLSPKPSDLMNIFSEDEDQDKSSSDDELVTQMPAKKRRKIQASVSDSEDEAPGPSNMDDQDLEKDEKAVNLDSDESDSNEMVVRDRKMIESSDED